jgi:prophage regulatory protein
MRILRKPDVRAKTGLGDRAIDDLEDRGHFPRRFLISPENGRAVGWAEHEIDEWIAERLASRVAA